MFLYINYMGEYYIMMVLKNLTLATIVTLSMALTGCGDSSEVNENTMYSCFGIQAKCINQALNRLMVWI